MFGAYRIDRAKSLGKVAETATAHARVSGGAGDAAAKVDASGSC